MCTCRQQMRICIVISVCYCSHAPLGMQRKPGKYSSNIAYSQPKNITINGILAALSMIQFCNHCGAHCHHLVPPGDSLRRHVCSVCGHIQYENPRLVVGCVAEWEGRLLICRRAIEPRHGFWTLPAGFMENGETTAEAAKRETLEEACASVTIDAPYAMLSIAHINQVHLFYRGSMVSADCAPGEESLEVALVRESEIPWDDLAFRSVQYCLARYLEDRKAGKFGFHESNLAPLPSGA